MPGNKMEKKPWLLSNQFLQAIEAGNSVTAAKILNEGFDVDSVLIDGKSAISICVERGCIEIAKLLIAKGCSLSLKSSKGESPLHLAVQRYNYSLVDLLLENRADVTCINTLGRTALHTACQRNSLDFATLLLNKSPSSINIADRDGATPLMFACRCGSPSLVKCLIEKGGNVNVIDVRGESPLLVAQLNTQCTVEMLSLLLDSGADVLQKSRSGDTALLRTLQLLCLNVPSQRKKLFDLCMLLIDFGSDLNAQNLLGQTPLHLALSIKDVTLVKKILNLGCNTNLPDFMEYVPLHYACRTGVQQLVYLLIDSGANLYAADWSKFKHVVHSTESISLLNYVIMKSKKCSLLTELCRTTIRKNLRCIPKGVLTLPIPPVLKNYILLDYSVIRAGLF